MLWFPQSRLYRRLPLYSKAVGRVVGDPHRFLFVGIVDDNQDWPEDFFTRDRHVVADIGKD